MLARQTRVYILVYRIYNGKAAHNRNHQNHLRGSRNKEILEILYTIRAVDIHYALYEQDVCSVGVCTCLETTEIEWWVYSDKNANRTKMNAFHLCVIRFDKKKRIENKTNINTLIIIYNIRCNMMGFEYTWAKSFRPGPVPLCRAPRMH